MKLFRVVWILFGWIVSFVIVVFVFCVVWWCWLLVVLGMLW